MNTGHDIDDLKGDLYGFKLEELSYKQMRSAVKFHLTVEPWLKENVGEFGDKWFVELDKLADDFRLQFHDEELETWFQLAWMHRDKESEK